MQNALLTLHLLAAASVFAQPQSPPSFDAASIKPTAEAIGSSGWDTHPGSIELRGQSLKGLIRIAYGLKEDQVAGGPKWLDADRFDIRARAVGSAGDPQLLMMLQALLADRFHLTFHHEQKVGSEWVMVTAKTGLKIHPAEGASGSHSHSGNGLISATGITMAKLAETLARTLRSPVSDMTGAQGVFDVELAWSTEGDATDNVSALSGVLQDKLGIRLELRKVPMDVIVVDQAEKPTEN